jgi:hypothetical protein
LNKTNALRRQEWTPLLADFLEGARTVGAVKDSIQKTEFRRQKTEDRRQNPRTQNRRAANGIHHRGAESTKFGIDFGWALG